MVAMRGVLCVFLSASLHGGVAKRIPSFAGPYICYGERFAVCDEGPSAFNWTHSAQLTRFNPYKPSERQIMFGNFTSTHDFDDASWMDITVALRANNQWKKNAFKHRFPDKGCSVMRSQLPSLFFAAFTEANRTGVCCGPAGTHIINSPLDWNFPSIPVFPYGYYLAEIRAGRGTSKKATFCGKVYLHVIPKAGV